MDRKTRQTYLRLKRQARAKEQEVRSLQERYQGVRPSWVSTDLAIANQQAHDYHMAANAMLEASSSILDPVVQIDRWFSDAIPDPQDKNRTTQLGVHFEEVWEMVQPLIEAVQADEKADMKNLLGLSAYLDGVQREFKVGNITMNFDEINRETLLDSLCDQIVTAIGVARLLGMDIHGALQEVADSNDSKFDENGDPIFDENLKLVKGPSYFKADLTPYVKGDDSK